MKYKVTDPQSGKSLILVGDKPPGEADIQQAFASQSDNFFSNLANDAKGMIGALPQTLGNAYSLGNMFQNPAGAMKTASNIGHEVVNNAKQGNVSGVQLPINKQGKFDPGVTANAAYQHPLQTGMGIANIFGVAGMLKGGESAPAVQDKPQEVQPQQPTVPTKEDYLAQLTKQPGLMDVITPKRAAETGINQADLATRGGMNFTKQTDVRSPLEQRFEESHLQTPANKVIFNQIMKTMPGTEDSISPNDLRSWRAQLVKHSGQASGTEGAIANTVRQGVSDILHEKLPGLAKADKAYSLNKNMTGKNIAKGAVKMGSKAAGYGILGEILSGMIH